jgi:hypothetical protein
MVSPSVAEAGRLNVLHTVRKATGLERKQTYALKERMVHHAQLAPWEVVLELLLRLAEVEVALLVLCSVVSFVLPQPLWCWTDPVEREAQSDQSMSA